LPIDFRADHETWTGCGITAATILTRE